MKFHFDLDLHDYDALIGHIYPFDKVRETLDDIVDHVQVVLDTETGELEITVRDHE